MILCYVMSSYWIEIHMYDIVWYLKLYENVMYELCVNVMYFEVVVFLLWFDINDMEWEGTNSWVGNATIWMICAVYWCQSL